MCKTVQLFWRIGSQGKKKANFIVQNLDYKQFFLDNVWVSAVLEIDFLVSNRGENKLFLTLMAYLSVKKKFRYLSWSWLSCNIKFSGMQNLSMIYGKLTQSMCLRLMKRCNFFLLLFKVKLLQSCLYSLHLTSLLSQTDCNLAFVPTSPLKWLLIVTDNINKAQFICPSSYYIH